MNSAENLPLISVVIPNHNGAGILGNCLRSLQSQTYRNMEIIVVDNGSRDRSIAIVEAITPEAIVIRMDENLGFAAAVNAGLRSSHGEWIAVLNNDTEVTADWLAACARAIGEHPEAAFFACRILDFSDRGRIYSAGDCYLRAGIGYRRGQELHDRDEFHFECPIFAASGCAALYRKQVLEKAGGFDERFFAYMEDVDLGLRLKTAGCSGYYLPGAEVFHHGAKTSGGEFSRLAVRLRTRNSLLLLFKSVPARFIIRSLPMIILSQIWWLLRVLAHKRLGSYIRGLGQAVALAPEMIRERSNMRVSWRVSKERFWQEILHSEILAGRDFAGRGIESGSLFLKWYFRVFSRR